MSHTKSAESPQVAVRTNASKPRSVARTPVNNLRLSDIAKLVEGRHGFFLADVEWAKRYFFAALPHVIVSQNRWLDAVRSWCCMWTPVLVQALGAEWIDHEARMCHAKTRKTPRQDKLCRLLSVQASEVADFGLCTLTPATETAQDRIGKDKARRRKAEADRRAKQPNYKSRSESKAATARASGTTASAIRSKAWRQNKVKRTPSRGDAQEIVTSTERVSCPADEGFKATDAQYFVTTPNAFRAPQYRLDCERVSCPTTNTNPSQKGHPYKQRADEHRTVEHNVQGCDADNRFFPFPRN